MYGEEGKISQINNKQLAVRDHNQEKLMSEQLNLLKQTTEMMFESS
jgi:hypothetical protein